MRFKFDKSAGRPKNKQPIPDMKPFEEIRDRAQKLYDTMLNAYNNKTAIVDDKLKEDIYQLRSLLRQHTYNPFEEN